MNVDRGLSGEGMKTRILLAILMCLYFCISLTLVSAQSTGTATDGTTTGGTTTGVTTTGGMTTGGTTTTTGTAEGNNATNTTSSQNQVSIVNPSIGEIIEVGKPVNISWKVAFLPSVISPVNFQLLRGYVSSSRVILEIRIPNVFLSNLSVTYTFAGDSSLIPNATDYSIRMFGDGCNSYSQLFTIVNNNVTETITGTNVQSSAAPKPTNPHPMMWSGVGRTLDFWLTGIIGWVVISVLVMCERYSSFVIQN